MGFGLALPFLCIDSGRFLIMDEYRLTKADAIGHFSRHLISEGWSIEPARSEEGEIGDSDRVEAVAASSPPRAMSGVSGIIRI